MVYAMLVSIRDDQVRVSIFNTCAAYAITRLWQMVALNPKYGLASLEKVEITLLSI